MPTPSQSAEALKEAKQKLDDLQIPFCLFLGTSLGAYRDGTFCPGDEDDIDVAVLDTYYNRIPEIKEAFKDWSLYHHLIAKDGLCQELSFKKTQPEGFTKVDIFFISEIDGKLAWRFYMGDGEKETITKYFPKEHFEHFDKVNFFGKEYNVPGNIEKYLELNYGDWKTPIHRKDWVWYQDNKAPITSKPLVSVIIPVWGEYKKYLDECVASVKAQTYDNYEIIIVDTETDLPTARNVGIRKAKGEYILCLDVDDTIFPTYLEETVGKDDIVSVGQQMTEDSSALWIPKEHPVFQDFLHHNQIHCCSLFKKEIWETVEGFDENMKDGYEDYDFWLQALMAGYTVTTIQKPLFNYRRHGSTMIDSTTKKHEEIINYMLSKFK